MKRIVTLLCLLQVSLFTLSAQEKFIDHLSVGVNYGTTSMGGRYYFHYMPFGRQTDGFGIEVSMQLTDWLETRAGFSATVWGNGENTVYIEGVPDGKYVSDEITLCHKFGTLSGSLFLDFYPFKRVPVYFIAGAYAGSNSLLKVYSDDIMPSELALCNTGVVELHGVTIPTDRNGRIEARVKMPAVRPYLGAGISTGRMASDRVIFSFDVGVMYKGRNGMTIEGADGNDVEVGYWRSDHYISSMVSWNKKCAVAPLISLRLFVKIF